MGKVLVISGVGNASGGILSVLRSVVSEAERTLDLDWRIVVLAHKRSLLECSRAEVREFPAIKSSWLRRLWFEWVSSSRIAKELAADAWLAMHDMTPRVSVPRQYVYCHSPSMFATASVRDIYFDWKIFVHRLVYRWVYALNIQRNTAVFVQQSWIRKAFLARYRAVSVIVARPMAAASGHRVIQARQGSGQSLLNWVFPTFPRHFKNVEVIGLALEILERRSWNGSVVVTIRGDENRYAFWLKRRFGHLSSLKFIGPQDAERMNSLYECSDGLIFPSLLETWGLPISEAQAHGLPMLVADLPYAHETVGSYDGVCFFDPADGASLANMMWALANGQASPGKAKFEPDPREPTLVGWEALIREVCQV
jgi:glycosyltransferase involved in cell wall biosynthesis